MSGWPLVSLGEVFDIARGGSPRPIDAFITDAADGINWISISDASDSSKYIERTKRRIRPEGASRSRTVFPGDFLLTNSMSFGRPYIMRTTGCIHDGWLALGKKREGIDHDFFFHLLGSDAVYSEFARLAAGVTVKNLNIELVKGVKVPVPPLPEQRRIAEVLDRAETLRAQRRQALAQLDALAEAIFLDMFGDPMRNPRNWSRKPIASVGKVITGNTPSRATLEYFGGSLEWIKSDNLNTPHDYATIASEHLSEAGRRVARLAPAGAILVTCIAGSSSCIGNAAMLGREVAFNQQINAFVPASGPVEFWYAQFTVGKRLFQAAATDGMKGMVSKSRFEQIEVIVPPESLQRSFAEKRQRIAGLRSEQTSSLAHLNTLFTSLQHRAFRGEL